MTDTAQLPEPAQLASASPADAASADDHDAVQNSRDERKRQRRLDARTWVPRESIGVIHQDIVIGSQAIRKSWNLLFVRVQTTMYMLQTVVPSTGAMEQARGIEKAIGDRMDEIEAEIRNETDRLRALAKVDGIEVIPPKQFTQPETITVPIYTPGAARYLNVIRAVDELYWMLDYLWIQGTIKLEHKFQIINSWKRRLWGMVKFMTDTWVRARRSLRDAQLAKLHRSESNRAAADSANEAATLREDADTDSADLEQEAA